MEEQLMRLTSIQSRLDEQRQRAEELQRAGTSDLNLKLYDLQNEVAALKETISLRDKQIAVLKNHLEQSKEIIDRQESEIVTLSNGPIDDDSKNIVEKLETEIVSKEQEIKNLKEKMRTEMIKTVALPDLMDTMLEDKTNEIDFLKSQLEAREKELSTLRDRQVFSKVENNLTDMFARGLNPNDIDNDQIRKMSTQSSSALNLVRKRFVLFTQRKCVLTVFFSLFIGNGENVWQINRITNNEITAN